MAACGSILKASEETYEYNCTSCAEDDLIKEALKYCVECQRYCCQDCLSAHRWIPSLKKHSFLDNSSVQTQGQPRSLPALPTKQCSKHVGMVMYMYCKNHDVVCCCVCAAEDHRTCDDMVSVSDNIDCLYSKTDTSKTASDINRGLDEMNERKDDNDALLQQLRQSKETAIKATNDFRVEMEQLLRKLEDSAINAIEDEYKKLETQLLQNRKKLQDSIDDMENLNQLFVQASENIAQQFVCCKLAQQYTKTMETSEIASSYYRHTELIFQPCKELKTSLESKTSLGKIYATSSRINDLYKVTQICDMNVRIQDDSEDCCILGSLIVDDTVLLTDFWNHKLKRFDILSSSLKDYCKLPDNPRGVCRVGEKEVAVACPKAVQFVSLDDKLSFSRSIKINHDSYGIAYHDDKLCVTDEARSLYMYDMSGNLLKTATSDGNGKALFERSNHITFSDMEDRLFVGDDEKGLLCFNAQCDYIETITDADIRPDGVCVDDYGNILVANYSSPTIVQCRRRGQKCGIIVNQEQCPQHPRSVCIHPRLKRMFVCSKSNVVRVFHLC
ncbi:hypothetical protein ACF0H5_017051 [Mactra antiquata]